MALNFDKIAQEGNTYIKKLAGQLGHPDEINRTGIILRGVLHTLRERITIGESLNLLSQMPMFMKAIYVDNWKYSDSPVRLNTIDEFTEMVESFQAQYGESEFEWDKSTREIVEIVFSSLREYVSDGQIEHLKDQLPEELGKLFNQEIAA